MEEHLK